MKQFVLYKVIDELANVMPLETLVAILFLLSAGTCRMEIIGLLLLLLLQELPCLPTLSHPKQSSARTRGLPLAYSSLLLCNYSICLNLLHFVAALIHSDRIYNSSSTPVLQLLQSTSNY